MPAGSGLADRPWSEARWIVVDIEGNGYWPPDLVEVAVVPVVEGRVGEPRAWLVKPPRRITPAMKGLHGITNTDVAQCPTAAEAEAAVVPELAGDVVVGHQVRTDIGVLGKAFPSWSPPPSVDTLRVAKALHPGLGSYKLGVLSERFGLNPDGQSVHRASGDAVVTARLLLFLAATLTERSGVPTVSDLLALSTAGRPSAPSSGQGVLDF